MQAVQSQEAELPDLHRQLPLANTYLHEVESGRGPRTHELQAFFRLPAQPVTQLGQRCRPDAAPLLRQLLRHVHGNLSLFSHPSKSHRLCQAAAPRRVT